MAKTPWWKGTHGEWFVVAQIALIVLVFFGPRNIPALAKLDRPLYLAGFDCGRHHSVGRYPSARRCDLPSGIEFDSRPLSQRRGNADRNRSLPARASPDVLRRDTDCLRMGTSGPWLAHARLRHHHAGVLRCQIPSGRTMVEGKILRLW